MAEPVTPSDPPIIDRPIFGCARGAEFVALVAMIMAVSSLGVDLMLPALPALGRDLAFGNPNHLQFIVTIYVLGLGLGQAVYGPLSDHFGRKAILLPTIACFVLGSLAAANSETPTELLCARGWQGFVSASTRVLSIAIIRDLYSGRRMARALSSVQMVFLVVPVMAPSVGQLLLRWGSWRISFQALAAFATVVLIWSSLRLPETLPMDRRKSLSFGSLSHSYRTALTNRYSIGYAVAGAFTFGGSIAYVALAQQIFIRIFNVGTWFGFLFGVCAFSMGCAAFANSRLVERFGPRRISQASAFTLVALSSCQVGALLCGIQTIWLFVFFQAFTLSCLGLCGANFTAMAMEQVKAIAGSASSAQGIVVSSGAALIAFVIGQSFGGTTLPLAVGYLSIGIATVTTIFFVEGSFAVSAAEPGR